MELKVIQNNKNEMLKRSEIIAEFDQKTIPSRDEIKKNISAQLNTPSNRIIIDKIDVKFGTNKGTAILKIYDSAELLQKNETEHLKKRNVEKEAPKEEASEETPAEKEAEEVAEQASEEKKE